MFIAFEEYSKDLQYILLIMLEGKTLMLGFKQM